MNLIQCTICGSGKTTVMLMYSPGVNIMHCKTCDNAFTFPKPQVPDYAREDFQAGANELKEPTPFLSLPHEIQVSYQRQLNMVRDNVSNGAQVLEIGGGEGIFLELLKSAGYEVALVEPSLTAAGRASQRGLTVFNDYFHNLKFERKYSLICLSHVLEHIDDPIHTIRQLTSLLEPSGFILLAQTNYKGFMPRLLKEHWYAWVPHQHFSHFSLNGLRFISHQTNLRVKEYRYSRLVHGKSIYHSVLQYIPPLQDQIHILLQHR